MDFALTTINWRRHYTPTTERVVVSKNKFRHLNLSIKQFEYDDTVFLIFLSSYLKYIIAVLKAELKMVSVSTLTVLQRG